MSCQSSFAHRTASANGHSAETSYRIKSGHPEGHFYGASGACNTGKWIGHKGNFFKGGIRVPAIISYPARLPKGEVRNQIITAMDWYPTVLELCGVKPKVTALKLDGHNLLPMIESTDVKSGCNGVLHFQWGEKWAVREGEWKLIGTDGKLKMTLHRLTDAKPETLN